MDPPNMSFEPIIVSACLLGVRCRFDGASKSAPRVLAFSQSHVLVPVCPEQLGGLPTPRPRHECVGDRVVSEDGVDATDAFVRGAEDALRIAEVAGARRAVLKARSPSCGAGAIYDGTFRGRVVEGDGVFAALLRAHGLTLATEEEP